MKSPLLKIFDELYMVKSTLEAKLIKYGIL